MSTIRIWYCRGKSAIDMTFPFRTFARPLARLLYMQFLQHESTSTNTHLVHHLSMLTLPVYFG
jgi:hypothetical protein